MSNSESNGSAFSDSCMESPPGILTHSNIIDLTDICTNGTGAHVESMVDAGGLEQLIAVLALENTEEALLLAMLNALRKIFEFRQDMNCKELQHLFWKKNRTRHWKKMKTCPSCSGIVCQRVSDLMKDFFSVANLKDIVEDAKNDSWEVWSKALRDLAHICTSETGAHVESMVDAGGLEQLIAVLALENTEEDLLLAVLEAWRKIFEFGQEMNCKQLQHFSWKKNGTRHLKKMKTCPSCSVVVCQRVDDLMKDFFGVANLKQILEDAEK